MNHSEWRVNHQIFHELGFVVSHLLLLNRILPSYTLELLKLANRELVRQRGSAKAINPAAVLHLLRSAYLPSIHVATILPQKTVSTKSAKTKTNKAMTETMGPQLRADRALVKRKNIHNNPIYPVQKC